MKFRAALAFLVSVVPAACIPSNVVGVADRTAGLEAPVLDWQPARAEDVPGLYRSTSIEGRIAASVLKLYYFIEPDGSFTGTVLLATSPARFEVVAGGAWTFTNGTLQLGADAAAATLEAAAGHLRLTGADGAVVLRRERTH